MRILGLDVGTKRVGVAISDQDKILALPLLVLERERAIEKIAELSLEYQVAKIVCGLPLKMNGKIGEQAEDILAFIAKLKERLDIPVATIDERLSTKEIERMCGKSKKHRQVLDKLSAQIILQTFLDRELTTNEHQ
ncbi:MAG: Holliday junction resolvase RuvX [bacterium]|nr:Holliday junction resolvase RuvX [bacterium]